MHKTSTQWTHQQLPLASPSSVNDRPFRRGSDKTLPGQAILCPVALSGFVGKISWFLDIHNIIPPKKISWEISQSIPQPKHIQTKKCSQTVGAFSFGCTDALMGKECHPLWGCAPPMVHLHLSLDKQWMSWDDRRLKFGPPKIGESPPQKKGIWWIHMNPCIWFHLGASNVFSMCQTPC